MQTRCPQCKTVSPLEADRPQDKSGLFGCPSCGAKFDPYAHLTDAMSSDSEPVSDDTSSRRDQGDLFARPRATGVSVPRFARQRVRSARHVQWRWWLASFVLALALLTIIPIADRDELALNPDWRPRLQGLCHWAGCDLPAWYDPKKFEVTAREINPHPSAHGVHLITVSFVNNAQFAQAWPLLELTESDLNGRVVGMRRFMPREYLGGAPETQLISPGQSASATLEVVDPGDAVSWDFEFR